MTNAPPKVPSLLSRPCPRLLGSSLLAAVAVLATMTGCNRLRLHGPVQYVYVQSKGTFLRDRVAAVSNKVVDVHNADKLTVLAHERRFYKVRTSEGKEGWLEEHAVIDQEAFDRFQALSAGHASDPVVATAILRDELFLHIAPGRKSDHLFLLPENDKLQLLIRAAVEKPEPPQGTPVAKPVIRRGRPVPRPGKPARKVASGSTVWAASPTHPDLYTAPDLEPPEKPLEDWWLIRDQGGHVGWMLARRIDVDIPDQVAQYSEGKKIVGAYQLNTVYDDGGPSEDAAERAARKAAKAAKKAARLPANRRRQANPAAAPAETPPPVGRQVPQYVTVTQEFKEGLPYDWDQVRVFMWNTRKHRYETAYRLREQQGYLPVTIGEAHFKDGNGRDTGLEPTFTIRTTPDGIVTRDANGSFHAQTIESTTYRLDGGIVRRADPPPPKPEALSPAAPSNKQPAARKHVPVRRKSHGAVHHGPVARRRRGTR